MRLKEVIQYQGLFQKDVADALGIKRNTFNNYCKGLREPPLDDLKRIANYLGVSVDYLLGGEAPKEIQSDQDFLMVPVIGEISAGNPHIMEEDVLSYMPLPRRGVVSDWLCLRVDGDSMDQAGLVPGSIAVFWRTPYADDGKIVAASIGDSATVKRFYRDGDNVILVPQSSNPEHKIQRYNLKTDSFRILGTLYSVTRYEDT